MMREIPVMRRGRLDVSLRPPALWWNNVIRDLRPAVIKLIGAIMSEPVVDVDDLLDIMGWDTVNTLRTKVGDARALLAAADLPVQIVSIVGDDGRSVTGFRIEVEA